MTYEVTDEMRQELARDGVTKLPGLVDAETLEELKTCFEWSIHHPGPIATGKPGENVFFVDNGNPEARPMYEDLVVRAGFPQVAADLWQSEFVGFFAEEIFWKKGRSPRTGWHQDTSYQPWRGEHWVNFWIPLSAMRAKQALQVVRGSHLGIQYDGTTFNPHDPTEPQWGDAANFPRLPDIAADLAKDPNSWDIVAFDVELGDAIAMHPHALHGGGSPSRDMPERRNVAFRFMGDKSYFSDHLPKEGGLYEHVPLVAASGRLLEDGELYRPAIVHNLVG